MNSHILQTQLFRECFFNSYLFFGSRDILYYICLDIETVGFWRHARVSILFELDYPPTASASVFEVSVYPRYFFNLNETNL